MPHLPNPPFVFPARDPDAPDTAPETEGHTPPPLPAFSFNPGSEPLPPPNNVPSRLNGHRRRPSEFVGGDQLVTPGAGESEKREEPSVSGVDLNAIQRALIPNSGSESAPTPPGDPLVNKSHDDISKPLSYSAGSLGRPTPPASPRFATVPPVPDIPPVPPIPSTINLQPAPSDDEEKPSRPVSAIFHPPPDSPSSVLFEPPEIPAPPVIQEPPPDRKIKPRPKTADASLAFQLMQSQESSKDSPVKRSKSTGNRRARKSMSNLLDIALTNHGLIDDAHSTDTSRPSLSDDGSETASDVDDGDESKPRSKSKKKQKRVRSWAGSLLTRKAKHQKDKKQRPPALTPPALSRTNSDVGSAMDVDLDNDVVVIRTPTNPDAPSSVHRAEGQPSTFAPAPPPVPSLETAWKPRTFYEQTAQEDTLSSPVIDLDAALGPFNTPDMRPARGTPSKFVLATQNMYSGGRRGEFVGPEMRYHRRTESAPVMQPFDRSAFTATRLGGAAPDTPDVFYEEEEDAFLAANQSPKNEPAPGAAEAAADCSIDARVETPLAAMGDDEKSTKSVQSSDSADTLTRAPTPAPNPQQAGLGIQSTADRPSSESQSEDSKGKDTIEFLPLAKNPSPFPPRSPVEILKSEECAPKQTGQLSPDVSPRFLAVDKRPATSPNELLPSLQPSLPPFSLSAGVSPSDSSFPSPDVPRFSDRNFSSYSHHHLPSDYQYASVEDVPSLTSSASTMTNTLGRFSASFFPRARLSTDRAASFSATVHRRNSHATSSKRSSLASLSKLVGGPNSERSKLSQEEKPPSDIPEKNRRKSRRLNRLMHFWKVKDKEKSTTDPAGPSEPSV
ncbi:hypothetical protein N7468_002568 [Penicillium chermesinum]|uniref:Cell wall proline rich protein n=1 Tax=Penicillium chermesinum TaxID=63820 RepID=A0A9W9TXS3_9EURO|nr:uncharacterized protein N7468_002568 [Penicillium chermesinum]KAJ5247585.1 hypothetical protein N7468_002568 [Penicillium chermesinum]